MLDVFVDAILDTLKILPLLLVVYIFIELIEQRTSGKVKYNKILRGVSSPFVATVFGLIPQCGFSVIASNLYSKRAIRLSSLVAIFIATSDEALPIMLANPNSYDKLWKLIVFKLVFALVAGYIVYAVEVLIHKYEEKKLESNVYKSCVKPETEEHTDSKFGKSSSGHEIENNIEDTKFKQCCNNHEIEEHTNSNFTKGCNSRKAENHIEEFKIVKGSRHEPEEHTDSKFGKSSSVHETKQNEEIKFGKGCCHHEIEGKSGLNKELIIHPVIHSLKICLYIFIVNFVLNTIIYYVGIDNISEFVTSNKYAEPFVACLVGLIPNCASSVILVELYIKDAITFGGVVAGLSVNAGIGMAVLLKQNKPLYQSVLIILGLYVVSSVVGLVTNIIL